VRGWEGKKGIGGSGGREKKKVELSAETADGARRTAVPDKRTHRGAHPQDDQLFDRQQQPVLQRAVGDMSWLLSKGYAEKSSLKLVGDRYSLPQRQRIAVMRSACSDEALVNRQKKEVHCEELAGKKLVLDGYNIITTVESALGGAVVIKGRDGCLRDIAGLHGTYRKVGETLPALELIGKYLEQAAVEQGWWYLDRPVSNSGRLKKIIEQTAAERKWNWQVEVVFNPDTILAQTREIVATSDSEILNRCGSWFNLANELVVKFIPGANLTDLSGNAGPI